jgi:hypothetical protein
MAAAAGEFLFYFSAYLHLEPETSLISDSIYRAIRLAALAGRLKFPNTTGWAIHISVQPHAPQLSTAALDGQQRATSCSPLARGPGEIPSDYTLY